MQAAGIDPEVVLAWAAELDFDAFEQEGSILNAYVPADRFDEAAFGRLASEFPFGENLRWTASLLEDKNWNETWEKQYEPVRIDQRVTIRAPFIQPHRKAILLWRSSRRCHSEPVIIQPPP